MKKPPSELTLNDYQELIKQLVLKRGFDTETIPEVFMLLTEEVGEFAKATRKAVGVTTDSNSKIYNLNEEAADVFWLLIDLCNRLNINLEKAFADKEVINEKRKWS